MAYTGRLRPNRYLFQALVIIFRIDALMAVLSHKFVSGNIENRGKQYSLFPKGPVIKRQNKTKATVEKRAEILTTSTTSGHLRLHALITFTSGQHFAGAL